MTGLKAMIARYNARAALANKQIIKQNDINWAHYVAGNITLEQCKTRHIKEKQIASGKPNKEFARAFLKRFKWSERKISAPANALGPDDPKIEDYTTTVANIIKDLGVDTRLLINYDQLWRLRYRGPFE